MKEKGQPYACNINYRRRLNNVQQKGQDRYSLYQPCSVEAVYSARVKALAKKMNTTSQKVGWVLSWSTNVTRLERI